MDVVVYEDVNVAFGVVPFQVDYTVKGAVPVDCAFIVVLNCMYKVICVILGELIHAEVVKKPGESYFVGVVFTNAWGVLHWVISKG